MGAFGIDSKSESLQTIETLSDSAQQIKGTGSRVVQGEGKGAVGNNSHFVETGGLDLAGAKNNNFGLDLSGLKLGKDASFTLNQGVSQEELTGLLGSVTSSIGSVTATTGEQIDTLAGKLGDAFGSLKDLAAQKSDAESGNPKAILWVALAGIAAFALVLGFIFRK